MEQLAVRLGGALEGLRPLFRFGQCGRSANPERLRIAACGDPFAMIGVAPTPAWQWPDSKDERMSRGFPSMTALLALLAVAGYQNRDKLGELLKTGAGDARPGSQEGLGGLLGKLAGGIGAGGLGGFLGNGLGELVDRFKQSGHGDVADSWISTGPNKQIAPPELEQAIGPDVLEALSKQTGLSKQEVVARLSRELPSAVDKYTPEGRLPAVA